MVEVKTLRTYEIKTDDNGLIAVPIDVFSPDSLALSRRSFHLSTGAFGCTMRSSDLQALGYDVSSPVVLPLIRIGAYDFLKIPVGISDSNTIGANILKWVNFSISNSDNLFEIDLIPRIKGIVEKGINPSIKLAYTSTLKGSEYNDNYNWYTWEEIDRLFPESWILLSGGDDELDYGGEVMWHSETEVPDTSQENTFLYCNKTVATQKPFVVQYEGCIRCRGYGKADMSFYGNIEEWEAKLSPPIINRFYYDTVSRQGKLFRISKAGVVGGNYPDAVLTQEAIDALFSQLLDDESV